MLVCCCTAGTSAQPHLAGAALLTPVHGHSSGPTAPCVLCCTISILCAVPHYLVLCTAPHCVCPAALHLWAVGSGQELLLYTLPGGTGQCNSCNALPHCLWAVGSGTPAMHCLAAWGQWALELLQCTATLPGGSGQWNSCNALPRCLGAVGSGTPAMHCLTACGQRAVQLLQCTASLPWGQWAVQLLLVVVVVWFGVVWCGVVWCGVVWCGVVWCGVVWCGVVWCGVVWCGVVWCGVVWCVAVLLCCVVLCCVVLGLASVLVLSAVDYLQEVLPTKKVPPPDATSADPLQRSNSMTLSIDSGPSVPVALDSPHSDNGASSLPGDISPTVPVFWPSVPPSDCLCHPCVCA